MSKTVFCSLWNTSNLLNFEDAFSDFKDAGAIVAQSLFDSFILYDEVYFATSSFQEFFYLEKVFGVAPLLRLLRNGRLKFVFVPHNLAYSREIGMVDITLDHQGDAKRSWIDKDAAIEFVCQNIVNQSLRKTISKILSDSSIQFECEKEQMKSAVFDLAKLEFAKSLAGQKIQPFKNFVIDLPPDKLQVFSGFLKAYRKPRPDRDANEAVSLYLSFGYANLEAQISRTLEVPDVHSNTMSRIQADSKLKSVNTSFGSRSAWLEVKQLAAVPNLSELVTGAKLPFEHFVEIVDDSSARKFRRWFENAEMEDEVEARRAYVELIKDKGIGESFAQKSIKFLTAQITGLNELSDMGSDVLGSFGLPSLGPERGARLFLERAARGRWSTPAHRRGSFATKI